MFNFDPKTGKPVDERYQAGAFITPRGGEHPFLPEIPAESPPYELVVTQEADPESPDGHAHYLIGGDAEVVKAIVAWYESQGQKVPDGYAAEAAAHAAAVEAAKK